MYRLDESVPDDFFRDLDEEVNAMEYVKYLMGYLLVDLSKRLAGGSHNLVDGMADIRIVQTNHLIPGLCTALAYNFIAGTPEDGSEFLAIAAGVIPDGMNVQDIHGDIGCECALFVQGISP